MTPAKKDSKGELIDFNPSLDPIVANLIQNTERISREAHLTKSERARKKKEYERIRERNASHTCYDIPPILRQHIASLAKSERVPASQIATLALLRFARDYRTGKINLDELKTPSRSPLFDWNLNIDPSDYLD